MRWVIECRLNPLSLYPWKIKSELALQYSAEDAVSTASITLYSFAKYSIDSWGLKAPVQDEMAKTESVWGSSQLVHVLRNVNDSDLIRESLCRLGSGPCLWITAEILFPGEGVEADLSHPLPSEVPFLNTNVAKCLPPGFDHRVSQLHSVNTCVLRVADRMADQYSSGAKAKCEGDLRN